MKGVNHSVLESKRGQWLNFIFVIVILVAVGIVYLVLTKIGSDVNSGLQEDASLGTEALTTLENHTNSTSGVFDAGVMIVLVGVWLLCLGLAYNSGSNPFLAIVALFIIVAMGFAGMILSNAWEELAGSDDFSSTRSDMPMTDFVLNNFLITILVIGFSTAMVAYSQRGGF